MVKFLPEPLRSSLIDKLIDIAVQHIETGGIPFAAIVVDAQGNVLGEGVNQVKLMRDPLAHAEIVAIRAASKNYDLKHTPAVSMIATGEPCGVCYLAASWAGVDQVIYLADRHSAAKMGFDYRWTYDLINEKNLNEHLYCCCNKEKGKRDPFQIWQNNAVI
ncbi:MAG: nucleoside deaminase [Oceanospirillaceae bacterium]